MQSSFPIVPGISAALQSLATFWNPSGVGGHYSMLLAVPVQKRKDSDNDKVGAQHKPLEGVRLDRE
jgi:hypothetical protein